MRILSFSFALGGVLAACGTDRPAGPPTAPAVAVTIPIASDAGGEPDVEPPAGPIAEVCVSERAALVESAAAHAALATCEEKAGHLIAALKSAQEALRLSINERDADGIRDGRARAKSLLERIPHITFIVPSNVENLAVSVDGRTVPTAQLTKKFAIEPGKHRIRATGTSASRPVSQQVTVEVSEGNILIVPLQPR